MRFARLAFAALVLAIIATGSAEARRHVHRAPAATVEVDRDGRGISYRVASSARHTRRHRVHHARRHIRRAPVAVAIAATTDDLVSSARRYVGTNPTGWAHVWCGVFMAKIAPSAAARIGNPNYALNWAKLPHTSPHVGAIAVMTRRGGGHVGVVSSFDNAGNPTIIAGNAYGHKVREYKIPRNRVVAWVSP